MFSDDNLDCDCDCNYVQYSHESVLQLCSLPIRIISSLV